MAKKGFKRIRSKSKKNRAMPYKSDAQRRWAHTKKGVKALGGKAKVKEWDTASKGKKLPNKVKRKKTKRR